LVDPRLLTLIRNAGGLDRGESDADLLDRFTDAADPTAFTELVRRYAVLVWGQCRHLLASEADAEDAFQATFLALARSAKTIRQPGRLGPWLHAVAYRICLNARRVSARRTDRERAAALSEATVPVADSAWDALAAAVHEEVGRLPEFLRVPFVLCYLEGNAPTKAARQLGMKWSTFSSRLTRAKRLLQLRLSARGFVGTALVGGWASSVPASLIARAIRICVNDSFVPAQVQSLSSGVTSMGFPRTKLLTVVAMMATAAGAAAAMLLPGVLKPAILPPSTATVVMAAKVSPENLEVKTRKLEELWAMLLVNDEAVSARAMLELSSRPRAEVVSFLAAKLKPLTISEERARKLLADLGDEKEQVVKAAFEELSVFDPRLVLKVGDILKELPEGVHRQRVVALLTNQPLNSFAWCSLQYLSSADLTNQVGQGRTLPGVIQIDEMPNKPRGLDKIFKSSIGVAETVAELSRWQSHKDWVRATRAVMLLEHFGTPEALKVLQQVASGHIDASPTKAAKGALERLNKK
jgi:RNA polymerase sigma factor (sigma-70 family)